MTKARLGYEETIMVSVGQMLLDLSPEAHSSIGLTDDTTPNDEAWRAIQALSERYELDPQIVLVIARIRLQLCTILQLPKLPPEVVETMLQDFRRAMDEIKKQIPPKD